MRIDSYFKQLEDQVKESYAIAEEARKKGFDPIGNVEVSLATSLAGRVAGLISAVYPQLNNSGIVNRILDLEKQYGALDPGVCLKVAEEVAKEKFCKFKSLAEGIDAGIRVGMAYMTLGVVSSPIEGFTKLEFGKTKEGKEYFDIYFSGPIRSAGGTAAAFSLVLADYLRELFGYAKYDPTEQEIKRSVTEVFDYHERITNLQYLPTEQEALFIAKNLPVQVNGDPSEEREVSNYKDLERINTNIIRGGFCLVFAEGICQKAAKIWKMVRKARERGFALSDWDFLEDFMKIHENREKGKSSDSPTYLKDLVAGRPVFSHPSRSGAFRLRYGRARNTGYSCLAIHPATMYLLDGFLAIGSQIKIEFPTKGCVAASCDSIDGPIVKMNNGGVRRVNNLDEAKNIYKDVEEILYIGDLLVPYGDFLNRNYALKPAGYSEEEWFQELKKAASEKQEHIEIENIYEVDFLTSVHLCGKFGIPLYPKYIFFWTQIDYDELIALLDWIGHGRVDEKLLLPYGRIERERFHRGKRALELLGVEHEVATENVVLSKEETRAFLFNLGIEVNGTINLEEKIEELMKKIVSQKVLENINCLAKFHIRDKAGSFIGSRMGRPEKGKIRKLAGSPNGLFPVGEEGGRMRNAKDAYALGYVRGDFPIYYCEKCKKETIYFKCEDCGGECSRMYYCMECSNKFFSEKCPSHGAGQNYMNRKIDMKHYFDAAVKQLNLLPEEIPEIIKGVRGTSNKEHTPENLCKAILRGVFDLQVNKDGTIRYDATEMPLTHFKPKEIGTSYKKLQELGYSKDINGKALENDEQVLEIFPHDIIIPCCPDSNDEGADDIFMRVANFVDMLLLKFYGVKTFYNVRTREDLAGHLVGCIAPHNCAAVVGRIIGFSKTQALIASPYIHAAMRRDCVHPATKLFFYDDESKDIFYGEIGEYVEKLIKEGAETKKIDAFETLQIENKKNIYALGIDPASHELRRKKIKYFIKGPEIKGWVKVTTATNREYIMTPTHKFMFIEDGKFKFKDAKEAKENDRIPILENFQFYTEKREIDLIKLFKEKLSEKEMKEILVFDDLNENNLFGFSGEHKNCYLRHRFSRHMIPAILPISDELMRILGYYAAEGYSRQSRSVSQVSFRICNREMQEYLAELILKCFGIKANLGEENSKITICSKLVYYLFNCLGAGAGAYNKRIPKFIFGLEKSLTKQYISAFFEGDGRIIKAKKTITFYAVSRNLLDDFALLLAKFRIFTRYFKTGLRSPGKKVLEKYKELGKEPKKHILNHLVLGVHDSFKLKEILCLVNERKKQDLEFLKQIDKRYLNFNRKQILLEAQSDYVLDYVKNVDIIKDNKNSYCVEIDWKEMEDRNILWGEQIINTRCDGDEAAIMMLLDMLLNFSRSFLPAHRGGTQDAPLVLNVRLRAGEVDDMIFDLDIERELPLELYQAANRGEHSSKIKLQQIKNRVGNEEFTNLGYTHEVSDINSGVIYSNYKKLGSMQEKVQSEMLLVEKIRSVDASDVAKMIIDRHFIRDIRGNLRKFSQQEFRCSSCNEKYRRPPLTGACLKCKGKIIFTISEGGIIKYLEPALNLAEKYDVPSYIKQSLELTKSYIESIFGVEKEKQEALKKWF